MQVFTVRKYIVNCYAPLNVLLLHLILFYSASRYIQFWDQTYACSFVCRYLLGGEVIGWKQAMKSATWAPTAQIQ